MSYTLDFSNPVLDALEETALIAVEHLKDYLQQKKRGSDLIKTAGATVGQYQRLHASVTERAHLNLIVQKLNQASKALPANQNIALPEGSKNEKGK